VKLDVLFGAASVAASDVTGRVVAVIDVLRASSTVAVALSNGARVVIPFESSEEVVLRSKSFERREVLLAGERKMRAIAGFDFGNSPREFTREAIAGRTVLFSTTNGTGALVAVQGARDVVVASYVNYSATLALLRSAARGGNDVTIVCAGHERQFSLEDAACAGRFVRGIARRMPDVDFNDAALTCALLDRRYGDDLSRLFGDSSHGRALTEAGFAEDLALCASIDAYPVVPLYMDRQITKLGSDWER
jgi:2-phosphosulfolactate phosphatase